ncbi:MAG: retroviral-like aspartic protease family protein [Bacteroidales bacterium]|nr:retroviral-like aspartic protease family protein [Bacteroidales bacterium]
MNKIVFFYLILIALVFNNYTLFSQVRIKMKLENGVYYTPCIVNGLKLRFIFDTGASNVSISLTEAIFMLKNGYLEESDLQGSSYSQLANGEIIENTRINIKEIEIGKIKIFNVQANIIHELSAPLLLGQSALKKIGRIQIENDYLLILDAIDIEDDTACHTALTLIEKAKFYYFDNLNALAADMFQKAYNQCPSSLSCYDLYLMGSAHYFREDNEKASFFLKKAYDCNTNGNRTYLISSRLATSYMEQNKYYDAEIFYDIALSSTLCDTNKHEIYFRLGYMYSSMGKYHKSIEMYQMSLDYYLAYTNIDYKKHLLEKKKNKEIGSLFYNIGNNYTKLNMNTRADGFMIMASLFGNMNAAEYCFENKINIDNINLKKLIK